ncbi:hypothetical protein N7454_010684 [Penicillium verhagenii]|nr:hypothetical protein N7454_010684 [Penicillium verhagenii]
MDDEDTMEDEDFRRPFHFFVTGRFIAIHYNGGDFELHRDRHSNGTLFYLSDDEEQIICNRTYVGRLTSLPDYPDKVFHIHREQEYLSSQGTWTDSIDNALMVQIDPEPDWSGTPPTVSPLANPVISADHPISGDGIDLYQPDQYFQIYPVGDIWMGNAERSPENMLFFGGHPYNYGLAFKVSVHEGKTRIVSDDGMFLTVMSPAQTAEYLRDECRQHTATTRCSHCEGGYAIGFVSEPHDNLTLVTRGLPSMFVFCDGVFYYQFQALTASYAALNRVQRIEDASLFQFVSSRS